MNNPNPIITQTKIEECYDNWQSEIEVFSARWERMYCDFPNMTQEEKYKLHAWLKAAMSVGIEYGYIQGSSTKTSTTQQ